MSKPKISLQTSVNPLAILRDESECVVTVELDVKAPDEKDGARTRILNLALVIDKSGSMAGEKIETAKSAATRVVERLSEQDIFTMIVFSEQGDVVVPSAPVGSNRQSAIKSLKKIETETWTMLAKGLKVSLEQINSYIQQDVVSAIFVLTDGQAQDQPECLQMSPDIVKKSIHLYAAGIGAAYDLNFLDQLCGKNNVDHIDQPEQMHALFERFLQREGRLVTADGRLSVVCSDGVKLKSIQAREYAQKIEMDNQESVGMKDLTIGSIQQYKVEFILVPREVGYRKLATFTFHYDIPGVNLRNEEVIADASIEITEDSTKANIPNNKVVELVRKIIATQQCQNAEADLERNDIRGATKKLEQATRMLELSGEQDKAKEVKERLSAINKANPAEIPLEIKRLRGTTNRLSNE